MASWVLDIPFLPVSANDLYGTRPDGGKYLTREARRNREQLQLYRNKARFVPDRTKRYRVHITFYVPTLQHDCDNRIKAAQDAIFGPRFDQRIDAVDAERVVLPSTYRTVMVIEEVG